MAKKKDDVTVVSIGVSTMPRSKLKKMKKAEMMMGGMANGKKHMYSAGGDVTDKLPNKGLNCYQVSPRVPRKKGQPAKSKKHSDLYTDENPKGTIRGLKFATVKDAEASVRKIRASGRTHAHKTQAAIAMEQRARAAGKTAAAAVYRKFIEAQKRKTRASRRA